MLLLLLHLSPWSLKDTWLTSIPLLKDIYLAATVLLAARLAPAVLLGEISQDHIQEAWQQALDILGRFQADHVSANRCVAALSVLYRKLPGGVPPAEQRADDPEGALKDADGGYSRTDGLPSASESNSWGLIPDMDVEKDLDMDWMFDLSSTDPYDMTWFQAIAPDFSLTSN